MRSTILVCSYNRPIQEKTRSLLGQMTKLGAALVTDADCADVTLTRNKALSFACRSLRQLNIMRKETSEKSPRVDLAPYDTILMVDDDMVFTLDQAQELINYSRANAVPASAIYATMWGTVAAQPLPEVVGEKRRWLTGLGLLAIPAWMLLKLEETRPKFELLTGTFTEFTTSSSRDGKWFSEDYELCTRLGGVHLLPIAVGHLKTCPIYPDEFTVNKVRNGEPIAATMSEAELEELNQPPGIARNAEGGRG